MTRYLYKGNFYYKIGYGKMKVGFWFWRKWIPCTFYKRIKGTTTYESITYARSTKEFDERFIRQ